MKKPANGNNTLSTRSPKPPAPPLQEPRRAPWTDLVAAGRRWLVSKWESEPKPTGVPPPWRFESGPAPAFVKVAKYIAATAAPHVPYTVDPDVTNDDMGYGERVSDELLRVAERGTVTPRTRVRQRTKTGWQVLTPAGGSRAPEDAPEPRGASHPARAATRTPAESLGGKKASSPRPNGRTRAKKKAE